MKKLTTIRFSNKPNLLTMLVLLGGMLIATAQTPGIPYQAYIIDTKGGYVPGEQIKLPLVNADIVLQFEIRNDKGQVEYIEQIPVKTDEFGMVSTVIGVGVLGSKPVMGKFSDIKWDGTPKKMHTDIDFSGSGTQFQDHGKMDIIYIPGPGSGLETVTSLAYNGDGSYTYTSEDGTTTTFSVPQHGGGDPNTLSMAGNVGDIYVDESSGDMYMHGGTSWVPMNSLNKGTGAPTATNPANPNGGDVYVDESTGDLYTYDGTKWIRQPEAKVTTSPGLPTATNPANPQPGDIYVDQTTGDVYTYNSTTNTWENQSFINANNGLTATGDLVQLGGNLIQPTAIGTDATNSLAVTGLENADMTTNQYDVMVVNNTTGVLEKTKVSALNIQRYIASYTATRGDDEFDTPQNILKVENIDAYRNGVRIDFVQVDADTIRLDLAAIGGCFPGDEIRIVQLQ